MNRRVIKSYEVTENKVRFFSMLKDIDERSTKNRTEYYMDILHDYGKTYLLDAKKNRHEIHMGDIIDIYDDKTFDIRGKELPEDEIMYPIKSIKLIKRKNN